MEWKQHDSAAAIAGVSPIAQHFDRCLLSPRNSEGADCEDAGTPPVLGVLARLLEEVVHRHEGDAARQERTSSVFHGLRPPLITLERYLERIFKYAACSPACYVLAYVYIRRLVQADAGLSVTTLSVHRLLVTCVLLGAKWLDDSYFNNAYYGKVGGVSTLEMNALELEALRRLEFRLYVTPEEFEATCAELEKRLLPEQAPATACHSSAELHGAGVVPAQAYAPGRVEPAGSARGGGLDPAAFSRAMAIV